MGLSVKQLGQYLHGHLGTAALREAKEDLIAKGVRLDHVAQTVKQEYTPPPEGLSPDQWLTAYMSGVVTSTQYDLATAPRFLAGALTRYFSMAAGADGQLTLGQVREKLGPRAAELFEMAADRAQAQLWETSASRALPPLPPNLTGKVSEDPRQYMVKFDREVLRAGRGRSNGMLRLGDDGSAKRIWDETNARLRRRNPQRRIAALLGTPHPKPPSMPALDALKADAVKTKPFKGAQVLMVQHLYGSTRALVDAVAAAGADPKDITVMGKPYSGSMAVAAAMVDSGYNVVASSLAQSELDDHDGHMDGLIAAEVERMLKAKSGPILVVDDGGAVAQYVAKHCDARTQARFKFVEQTQRGANVVKESGVQAPVVNVAESDAKKTWESPSIGHSVFLETKKTLDRLAAQGAAIGKELCIIGFGAVGSQCARSFAELPEGERPAVYVYDPDPVKQQAARDAGFTVCATKEEALKHASICISATGREGLKIGDYKHMPKAAVLVNAASANAELSSKNALSLQMMAGNTVSGVPIETPDGYAYPLSTMFNLDTAQLDEDDHLWDTFQGKSIDLGHDVSATQIDRVVHTLEGQDLFFANSGFVVNLTDDEDPIPPEYIGLTRSLLFGALVQAAGAKGAGLVDLDAKVQQRCVELTEGQLKKSGQSLLKPTFT